MSTKAPAWISKDVPAGTRVGIVAARFNAELVQRLLDGCQQRLQELGIRAPQIEVHRVPGAFELPLAAKVLARSRRFGAIICLGAVVRGQTPHFDFVAGQCARGIQQVALSELTPVIFGVLTTNTQRQAIERLGGAHGHAGVRAGEAAVEMISLMARIEPRKGAGAGTRAGAGGGDAVRRTRRA